MNRNNVLTLTALLLTPLAALRAADAPLKDTTVSGWVNVQPKENTVALRNPMKGWRGQIAKHYGWGSKPIDDIGTQPIGSDFESLRKWYVSWNDVESRETDGVEKLQAETDRILADFPARNLKAIPRLALFSKRGSEIPFDLPSLTNNRACDWYLRQQVRQRIERLIARAGQVWDCDPRIAYVEMGIVAKYGEQWDLGKFPEIERYLHAAYAKAFTNKPILIRGVGSYPWTPSLALAKAGPYGFFEDSLGVPMYEKETLTMAEMDGGKRWESVPIGGESKMLAYDDTIAHNQKGRNEYLLPSKKPGMVTVPSIFANAGRLDYFQDLIRQAHVSFIGSPEGNQLEGQSPEVIASLQKNMGYRFVLTEARFPKRVEPSQSFTFSFRVKNTGSSPIYGRWNVALCLVDPTNRKPVWTGILDGVDPRAWLPGRRYDTQQKSYAVPAQTYTVERALTLPRDLARGNYALALAVLDVEGGNQPAVRFAIENYWRGGLHPMGIIGVAQSPEGRLDSATFFLDGIDSTLHYETASGLSIPEKLKKTHQKKE
jgi:hypothetical protein